MRAVFSCQSPGAPDSVSTKVSQFTPSTHEASSGAAPPAAVPVQESVAPVVGSNVPEPIAFRRINPGGSARLRTAAGCSIEATADNAQTGDAATARRYNVTNV